MKFAPESALVIALVLAVFSGSRSLAQAANETICEDTIGALNLAMSGIPQGEATGYQLRSEGNVQFILIMALRSTENPDAVTRWRLLSRMGQDVYCLVGAGDGFEVLADLSDTNFNSPFGLPGSGYRRCNDATDGPLGSVAVRGWANKTLGESLIQALSDARFGNSYILLTTLEPVRADFPWVLLETASTGDGVRSCYEGTGESSDFFQDFGIREDWIRPTQTIPGY